MDQIRISQKIDLEAELKELRQVLNNEVQERRHGSDVLSAKIDTLGLPIELRSKEISRLMQSNTAQDQHLRELVPAQPTIELRDAWSNQAVDTIPTVYRVVEEVVDPPQLLSPKRIFQSVGNVNQQSDSYVRTAFSNSHGVAIAQTPGFNPPRTPTHDMVPSPQTSVNAPPQSSVNAPPGRSSRQLSPTPSVPVRQGQRSDNFALSAGSKFLLDTYCPHQAENFVFEVQGANPKLYGLGRSRSVEAISGSPTPPMVSRELANYSPQQSRATLPSRRSANSYQKVTYSMQRI